MECSSPHQPGRAWLSKYLAVLEGYMARQLASETMAILCAWQLPELSVDDFHVKRLFDGKMFRYRPFLASAFASGSSQFRLVEERSLVDMNSSSASLGAAIFLLLREATTRNAGALVREENL
jgi:hypothetical protein